MSHEPERPPHPRRRIEIKEVNKIREGLRRTLAKYSNANKSQQSAAGGRDDQDNDMYVHVPQVVPLMRDRHLALSTRAGKALIKTRRHA